VAGKKIFTGVSKQAVYDHVLSDLFELVGKQNYKYNRQSGELTLFGSEWLVIGAGDEGSEKRIRGETVGLAVCDEVVLMPRNFFLMLLSRMSPEGARLYGSTNAESPYHWLKTDVLDSKDYTHGLGQDVWCQTWLLRDNPNIGQKYIDFLDRSYVGVWHRRYVEGLWVLAEGAILSSVLTPDIFYNDSTRPVDLFSRNGHVSRVVSIDCGMNHAQVYGEFFDQGDTVFLENEFYYSGTREGKYLTNQQFADALILGDEKGWPGFPKDPREWPRVRIDPSALSFKVELQNRGVLVQDADNTVKDGIRRMASMLGRKKLRIHEKCVGIRGSLETYSWDEKACARGEEKPIKEHDDGADCCRYYIQSEISDWRLAA
jgi:PBSX family phage terminase large subunit